jgi:hypothetical protein
MPNSASSAAGLIVMDCHHGLPSFLLEDSAKIETWLDISTFFNLCLKAVELSTPPSPQTFRRLLTIWAVCW